VLQHLLVVQKQVSKGMQISSLGLSSGSLCRFCESGEKFLGTRNIWPTNW